MSLRKVIIVAVIGAVPGFGILGYEMGAMGQYKPLPVPPTVPAPVPPVAPAPPTVPGMQESLPVLELKTELKKAQIQSALSDKVTQVKEDAYKVLAAKRDATAAGQAALMSAELDAEVARAGAEVARLNVQEADVQLKNGQASYPAPGQVASPSMAQVLQLELKKAQNQSASAAKVADIRQRQYDLEAAQMKAGQSTLEKVSDAMLDLEAAKATAEVAKLDESLMEARLNAAMTGRR